MTGRWKESTVRMALVIASVTVALTGGELVLRSLGRTPWRPGHGDSDVPRVHEPDPLLGWMNKPGSYTIPRFVPEGRETQFTILADGRRRTSATPSASDNEIWLVGDSFTQGWAISDDETYGWLLQRALPDRNVVNFGVGGYGTYQSLLLAERLFADRRLPNLVLFGFAQFQEGRNVATPGWLRMLAQHSTRGAAAVPYCEFDAGGQLACHPPVGYPAFPLRESSALVNTLQDYYAAHSARGRLGSGRLVTHQLLTRFDALCRRHGVALVVVLLAFQTDADRQSYQDFLQHRGIGVLDCSRPDFRHMLVPGEYHPDGRRNRLWADCIEKGLALVR